MTLEELAEAVDDLTSEPDPGRRIEKGRELRRKVVRLFKANVGTHKDTD